MTAGQALAAFIALAIACVSNARADSPVAPALLFDFYPGEFHDAPPVSALQRVGDRLFFIAGDRDSPPQLWISEGTASTTRRVLPPGLPSTHSATLLTELNERALWLASTPDGRALWATDTNGRSDLLHDNGGGARWLSLGPPILNGRYYFPVCDSDCTLWSTDGSPHGTRAEPVRGARDLVLLGPLDGRRLAFLSSAGVSILDAATAEVDLVLPVNPSFITAFGTDGHLYLRVEQSSTASPIRHELWALGPEERRARRFYRSALPLEVQGFRAGRLYFVDRSASKDWLYAPLWSSDGTREGTVKLQGDLVPSTFSTFANQLGSAGVHGLLAGETYSYKWHHYGGGLFQVDDQQLRVDRVSNCSSSAPFTDLGSSTFGSCSGRLFRADGSDLDFASRLFGVRSDWMREIDGRLVLGGKSRHGQPQLWETDGTAAGTRSLSGRPKDAPFEVSGPPVGLNGTIFAPAKRFPVGQQLFRIEDGGTTPVTRLAHVAHGVEAKWAGDLDGAHLVLTSSELHSVRNSTARRLPGYIYGCYSEGPCEVPPLPLESSWLYRQGLYLARTDGTEEGTRSLRLTTDNAACADSLDAEGQLEVAALSRLGSNSLVLDENGRLWTSDGTESGTSCTAQIEPPHCCWYEGPDRPIFSPGASPDWLYLAVGTSGGRRALWRTDGTPGGTWSLTSFPYGGSGTVRQAAGLGFFIAGDRLSLTDGTAAGTRAVADTPIGFISEITTLGDKLYVSVSDGARKALWVHDPVVGSWSDLGAFVTIDLGASRGAGNALFFVATALNTDTGETPQLRLWRTTGTPQETHPIIQAPATANSGDSPLISNGRIYFTGCDAATGCELWSVAFDGSGAKLEVDLWRGPRSSDPTAIGESDTAIYFSATDPDVGREVWSIPKH